MLGCVVENKVLRSSLLDMDFFSAQFHLNKPEGVERVWYLQLVGLKAIIVSMRRTLNFFFWYALNNILIHVSTLLTCFTTIEKKGIWAITKSFIFLRIFMDLFKFVGVAIYFWGL